MITTTNEVYEFTELTMKKCREHGYDDIAQQFDDAMHLGSSGLEILGAIKAVLMSNAARMENVVDKAEAQEVVKYVNRVFGIE